MESCERGHRCWNWSRRVRQRWAKGWGDSRNPIPCSEQPKWRLLLLCLFPPVTLLSLSAATCVPAARQRQQPTEPLPQTCPSQCLLEGRSSRREASPPWQGQCLWPGLGELTFAGYRGTETWGWYFYGAVEPNFSNPSMPGQVDFGTTHPSCYTQAGLCWLSTAG